jgi:tetraacyldisaccharide 4'-kinase
VSAAERPWLAPLGALFGTLAALRVALYRRGWLPRARLDGAVVSVGNLSVGGSGKTPVVARVAQLLLEAGLPVAILSRGYGGSFRGDALVVSDGRGALAGAGEAGDEPVMLARALPGAVVAVGARRDVVGRVVSARFGRRVFVLDDAFQHLRVERDLDLLCVDAGDESPRPLPAGRLREFPGAAARADLVLLTQAERAPAGRLEALEARFGPARTLRVGRRLEGFFDLDGRRRPPPARPFLLSGIARPERFEADVASCAPLSVTGHARFRDHHRFSAADVAGVAARARAAGADAVVTTAKDAVRLPDAAWGLPVLVLALSAQVHDEGRLRDALLRVARSAV